tara:strand:- start:19 stop:471 length:453 start_codon:yes stop_codon:yes gene_type:complete
MLLAALLILACTAIHYGALRFATRIVDPAAHPKRCLFISVSLITAAHIIEAAIYASAFWAAVHQIDIGSLQLAQEPTANLYPMDYFYFALVNLTTLGRGDLQPSGHLRFLTGISAFHGFLLITASGGYLLQVMSGKNLSPVSGYGTDLRL